MAAQRYKAGQTYKLKIEVGSVYSNPQLKYEWYYIPESNYTAEQSYPVQLLKYL